MSESKPQRESRHTGRARHRPLAECPAWALCCPEARRLHGEDVGKVYEAFSREIETLTVECSWCGRIAENVKYMRLTKPGREGSVLPIECFEFDEGVVQ